MIKGKKKGNLDIFGVSGQSEFASPNVQITSTYKSAESTDHETVKTSDRDISEPVKIDKDTPWISLKYKHTIPMRAYESAAIEISVTAPAGFESNPEMSDRLKSTHSFIAEFLGEAMGKEVAAVVEHVNSLKKNNG